MKRKLLFINVLLFALLISGCSSNESNNVEPTEDSSNSTSLETPSTGVTNNGSKDNFQYVDLSSITSEKEVPKEVETIVEQINTELELNLQFVLVGPWLDCKQYTFYDKYDNGVRNALIFYIDQYNGRYYRIDMESEDIDVLLDVSEMVAKKIGYNTYEIDELTQIFNDPSKKGSITEFIGNNGYGYSFRKANKNKTIRHAIDFKILD